VAVKSLLWLLCLGLLSCKTAPPEAKSDRALEADAKAFARAGKIPEAEAAANQVKFPQHLLKIISRAKDCQDWLERCENAKEVVGARECSRTAGRQCEDMEQSFVDRYHAALDLVRERSQVEHPGCGEGIRWGFGKFRKPSITCDRCMIPTHAPNLKTLYGEFVDRQSCETARNLEEGIVSDECHARFVGPDKYVDYWQATAMLGYKKERLCFRSKEQCEEAVAAGFQYSNGSDLFDIKALGQTSESVFLQKCEMQKIKVCTAGEKELRIPCDVL